MEREYEVLICPEDYRHKIDPDMLRCLECGAECITIDEQKFLEAQE